MFGWLIFAKKVGRYVLQVRSIEEKNGIFFRPWVPIVPILYSWSIK